MGDRTKSHAPWAARRLSRAATSLLALALGCDATGVPGLPGDPAGQNATATSPAGAIPPGVPSTPAVSASQLEQLSLERINRARIRPAQEAARYGIAIDEGIPGQLNTTPRQAVALNASLNQSARAHSQDMLARNYFEHDSPEGTSPFERMTAAGYTFIAAGENLAWRGTTGTVNQPETVEAQHSDLFVDAGIANRGHRVTMLNGQFREIGIGILRGFFTRDGVRYDSLMQTQNYGTQPADDTIVLGVVYNDANRNAQYDIGEGVASANVALGNVVKTTNAGGGYSFTISQAGDYTLRFHTGAMQVLTVSPGEPNIKVDLVDGNRVIVNLGLGRLP